MIDFHTAEVHEGQTVYLEPIGRKTIEGYTTMQTGKVLRIGFKYISVEANRWLYKFDVKTYEQIVRQGERKDWRAFFSKNDYMEYKYWNDCFDYIKAAVSKKSECTLSNEQMKQICAIISSGKIR